MFGERLKELRKSKGHLTQVDMAKYLGVAKTTYASYEQGKRTPDIDLQNKIADYFGVTLDYLHGRESKQNSVNIEKEITVEQALKSVMSSDGKPLTDHDREVLTGIIEAYIERKDK
ncbi:helix-turn-helix transcriptional regulator [Enterococcus pseudoavium]|uniref:Helix-turn-helix transcriptional regulator n=1 Tax=Enterococcus pseudoavium TaxID=44007 RepID=A0ABU3FIU8_9ENTE|nr:helix-turn-helix transcriptional regulator [Enterococcus pseudoavium]MDT2770989.1 helix-turn-helix transcriptional regulator [Enterococcus pseudoavium]